MITNREMTFINTDRFIQLSKYLPIAIIFTIKSKFEALLRCDESKIILVFKIFIIVKYS